MSDSQQLFDLVVLGHRSAKPVEALVKDILNLLDDNSAYLESKLSDALLFNNGIVSIRDGITFEAAQEIRKKLATLAVDCDIRPTLPLIPKEMEETGMEAEPNRHENDRAKRIREILERAKQEEEALLQAEARHRLGLAEKPDNIGIKIAAVVAALSISFGTVYYLNQPTPEEIAQQETQAAEEQQAKEEQQKEAMAKTMAATMEKAGEMADMLENVPASGAAGPTGDAEEAIAAPLENKPEPKTEERQAQMTEALKADSQQPETPAEVTEAKVKEEASSSAIIAMEEEKLTPPRLQVFPDVHAENRRRIQQFLKLNEADLTDMIIDKAEEPYQRALLLLDIVEWQLQNNKPDKAQETIARILQDLDKTQDISQQALILGCISKTHLLQDAWEEAGKSLQQAMTKAETLPQLPEQISLLTRLANEQSLFGNQIAARQILETAGKLSESLPESVEPRSSALVQLASGYAVITDFAEANKLMDKVQDPAKRQKLTEFIDKLQHRFEQVRAEYQQAAVN